MQNKVVIFLKNNFLRAKLSVFIKKNQNFSKIVTNIYRTYVEDQFILKNASLTNLEGGKYPAGRSC